MAGDTAPVLQVISGDLWAGAEAQCFHLCAALTRAGQAVEAVLFNEGELASRLRGLGLPVQVWDENRLGTVALVQRARALIGTRPLRLIHAHGRKESTVFGAANLSRGRPLRLINTVHGGKEHSEPWWRLKKQATRLAGHATTRLLVDHRVAVSAGLERALLEEAGRHRVSLIENAVDPVAVRASASEGGAPFEQTPALELAMVARAVPLKRHDLAVAAVGELVRRGHACRLWIAGDGPALEAVRRQVGEAGLKDEVRLLGEVLNPCPLIAAAGAVLMPSDHEGMPMTLLESLALGTPVIGHRVGGIGDVLEATGFGVAVDDHSAAGYANAIEAFSARRETLLAERESCLAPFRERFDIGAMCQRYLTLYAAVTAPQ